MKFSTVLGTFALSALEANRACASPLEPATPAAQSLEERNTEYCCMQVSSVKGTENKFVPYTDGLVLVAQYGTCEVQIYQKNMPPSQGGCGNWYISTYACFDTMNIKVTPQPASVCQKKK
ncbi:hypothetical protein E4U32_002494 [Claviceps aff. humidiphila group G2b]|nr:hypothetical protein E4U32_002494 [Claviceps aff. humidiphila group G2b]